MFNPGRNTKHQIPSSREVPESKHQKPSSEHQRNPKFQAPNRGPRFKLGTCSLELLWCLELGVWALEFRWSLAFGALVLPTAQYGPEMCERQLRRSHTRTEYQFRDV